MGVYNISFPDGRSYQIESDTAPSEELLGRLGGAGYKPGSADYSPALKSTKDSNYVPYEQRKSEKYGDLTNQDVQDIRDNWTTSTVGSFLLGGGDELLFGLPSRAVSSIASVVGADETADAVRAWREISTEEHPYAKLFGAITSATAASIADAVATVGTGGAATAPATAVAAGRWARVGQLASKTASAPITLAKGAAKKTVGKTAEKLAEGNLVSRVGGKALTGAIEGLALGAEYQLAQGAGTTMELASGAIDTAEAMKEYRQTLETTPYAMAVSGVMGGAIPPIAGTVKGAYKIGRNAYDAAVGKIRLRQSDIETFQSIVGKDALLRASEAMSAVRKDGELLLSSMKEGTTEYTAAQNKIMEDANKAFWKEVLANTDPEGAEILYQQVKHDPKLGRIITGQFSPVKKGLQDDIVGLTNRDYASLSEEINAWLGHTYDEGPKGVVKQLGKEHIGETLGRGPLMEEARVNLYSQGLDEVQARINSEKEGLFASAPLESTFKGKSGAVMRSAAQNANDMEKVASGISLDNIPSLKPGTAGRAALDTQIERKYEQVLRNRAQAAVDEMAQQGEISPELQSKLIEQEYQKLKKDINFRNMFIRQQQAEAQASWFRNITTNGTDDVRDLNYFKNVGNRVLEKDAEAGMATTWGQASENINNLFREYSGTNGTLSRVLNTDRFAGKMIRAYEEGLKYGSDATDKTKLQRLLSEIQLDTPDVTGKPAVLEAAQAANKSGALAYFKAGVLEQAQDAAIKGDVKRLQQLSTLMRETGGNGLGEYFTKGELASTFENLVPLAQAARNTEKLLSAAVNPGQQATEKGLGAPFVRLVVSSFTGGRNTAMNALVTILSRAQWSAPISESIGRLATDATAQNWNTLANQITKDPLLTRQFSQYLHAFVREIQPRVQTSGLGMVME